MTRFDTSTLQFPPSANSKFRAPTFQLALRGQTIVPMVASASINRGVPDDRHGHWHWHVHASGHLPLDNLARGVTTYRAFLQSFPSEQITSRTS